MKRKLSQESLLPISLILIKKVSWQLEIMIRKASIIMDKLDGSMLTKVFYGKDK
jgi:hypothetical protein